MLQDGDRFQVKSDACLWDFIMECYMPWMFLLENGRNQTCISGDFIAQTSGNDA